MSKSGSKSARIGTLLEQLQKLCLAASEAKTEQEKDLDQLRYVTNKIQHLLSSQEKCRKDLMTKFTDGIPTFLLVLELTTDTQLMMNVLGCLSELPTSAKRASVLASNGAVDVLLKVLIMASKESPPCEDILLICHVILTKVGPKDRKFCVKSRLTGALQITMNLIRNNTSNFRVIQTTLPVLKQYSTNAVNCNILGKAGAVSVLFKIVSACGHKRVTCLKLVLDVTSAIVKSKTSASKAVNYGVVPVLLQMFSDWQRTDHHNRQTGVRKAILGVLKSITMTKSGKKAFIQADGIKILYSLSLESLESRELDGLNNITSQILRRCFPKNKLPISSLSSPLAFPLLDLDSAAPPSGGEAEEVEEDSGEGESSDVESEEEFSGANSQEDREQEDSTEPKSGEETKQKERRQRPRDDLHMYEAFFPEQFEFQVESDDSLEDDPLPPDRIVIPTAHDDPLSPMSSFCCLHSSNIETATSLPNNSPDTGSIPKLPELNNPQSTTIPTNTVSLNGSPTQTSGSPTSQESTGRVRGMDEVPEADGSYRVYSVLPVLKRPSPDVYGHYPPVEPEPLGQKKSGLQRTMIFRDIDRLIQPQKVIDRVVFDLDGLLQQDDSSSTSQMTSLDKPTIKPRKGSTSSSSSASDSVSDDCTKVLRFESRFESGNLRKAIQVREYEYDLILNPDINCRHHHQWFYFEVSNMEADIPYRFNIVNCEKINSQFNFGMQPVLYSTQEATVEGRPGWIRTGSNICYYRNYYSRSQDLGGGQKSKTYFTSTFTITFPYSDDVCYLAYHYPYTYSMLQDHIASMESSIDPEVYYRRSTLCHSLAGNPCDVITITSNPRHRDTYSLDSFRNRPYIFLSARVHPGESNSSWVMKGVLEFLLSAFYTAKHLRDRFIFKIVPMLNPDGVINGCHRCSLSGDDLNRKWINPSMLLHPTIYHTKGLLQYMQATDRTPLVYCDFHGHSRKKNVFMYGCSTAATIAASSSSSADLDIADSGRAADIPGNESTSSMDPNDAAEDVGYRTLPRVLHNIAPAFSLGSCSFIVEPSKESTARVVVWREMGVVRSYTMESTYSGCDQGPYKGYHLGSRELEEMGRFFCAGLLRIGRPYVKREAPSRAPSSESNNDPGDNSEGWVLRTSELFVPVPSQSYDCRSSSEEVAE